MSDEPNLLNCPFCGGKAKVFGSNMVGCVDQTNCGANVDWGHYTTGSGPIDVWNTRADHAHALVAEAYEVAGDAAADAYDAMDLPAGSDMAGFIRALTPADAEAARDARDKQVREQALRDAAGVVKDFADNARNLLAVGDMTNRAKTRVGAKIGAFEAIENTLLARIEKGKTNE